MSVKVKAYEANTGYEDKYVSRNKMAFSFLSDDDKMVGPFVDCKDYMNNRIHGSITGIDGGNEYKFQPSKMDPVSMEKIRILVCRQVSPVDGHPLLEAKEFEDEIKLAIDLLNRIEKDLHLIKSTYSTVTGIKKEYGQVLLVEGSRRWMLASPMLSLYLFLLRNAYLHKEGQSYIKTIESSPELKSSIPGPPGTQVVDAVKFIVKHKYANVFGKSIEKNYPPEITSDAMHSMGIRGFSMCLQTHLWPHWAFPNKAVAVKSVKKLKEKVA